MILHAMTATFGKLNGETLTLTPGLNIIEAPNEWGKSTWCAFLTAMLYGIDTRSHTTKNTLADKERYAPWSGAPMSGKIDLNWQGRDITIERKAKGRIPFGDFHAYETATGIAVPELTAANCGEVLLGVERSVFLRSGFIRQENMPVTEDEALRRRLNALVTTGDESGAADTLERKLRELKNACRHNKTGLLPQAQAEAQALEQRLSLLTQAQQQLQQLTQEQARLQQQLDPLINHRAALTLAEAQTNQARIRAAEEACHQAREALAQLEQLCASLPSQEAATAQLEQLTALQQQLMTLQLQRPELTPVQTPPVFQGCSGDQAVEQAAQDYQAYTALTAPQKGGFPVWLMGLLALALGFGLLYARYLLPAMLTLGLGAVISVIGLILLFRQQRAKKRCLQAAANLQQKYGAAVPEHWVSLAQAYQAARASHSRQALELVHWQSALAELREQLDQVTGGQELLSCSAALQDAIGKHQALPAARETAARLERSLQSLRHLPTQAPQPRFPDRLTLSPAETEAEIARINTALHRLQKQIGHCTGQMEQLGQESALRQQLEGLYRRIRQLEDTYAALTLAQKTLTEATLELQRRFAPQITRRSQQLFARMTGGRYDRLTLTEDFRVQAAATEETTLHSAQFRSEGTVDQLYLALRLAVSEELTPLAPLVLDDALVRFDDRRLAAVLAILQEEAKGRQVLLFTCQSREKSLLS